MAQSDQQYPPAPPNDSPTLSSDDFVDTMTAALPPGLERNKNATADEMYAEWKRIPLFMTSLDEANADGEENPMLEALKAIAYEGTPAEVAANFREQGNECARMKSWTDAREFYTKAILTMRGKLPTVENPDVVDAPVTEVDVEGERLKERAIEEACLANRALCNLEMKNYGACTRDCAAALRLNPNNTKAWYRAAAACLSLDKLPEALDACHAGLDIDAKNPALEALLAKAEQRQKHLADLRTAREAREQAARNQQATLRLALRQRNIPTRTTDSPPEMEDAALGLANADDAASALSFPVLFLYPLHAQTDFVKAFREDETLGEHLGYILPVPWDEAREYDLAGVECYMETTTGGLIKAGKKVSLLKLLSSGKVEVVDGLMRVSVVPRKRAAEWIQVFKTRQGKK